MFCRAQCGNGFTECPADMVDEASSACDYLRGNLFRSCLAKVSHSDKATRLCTVSHIDTYESTTRACRVHRSDANNQGDMRSKFFGGKSRICIVAYGGRAIYALTMDKQT